MNPFSINFKCWKKSTLGTDRKTFALLLMGEQIVSVVDGSSFRLIHSTFVAKQSTSRILSIFQSQKFNTTFWKNLLVSLKIAELCDFLYPPKRSKIVQKLLDVFDFNVLLYFKREISFKKRANWVLVELSGYSFPLAFKARFPNWMIKHLHNYIGRGHNLIIVVFAEKTSFYWIW